MSGPEQRGKRYTECRNLMRRTYLGKGITNVPLRRAAIATRGDRRSVACPYTE